MKTNILILSATFCFLVLTSVTTCALFSTQKLQHQLLKEGILPAQLTYTGTSASLTGESLILYNASLPNYPSFSVHRIQIQNSFNTFYISLQGIHGSLMQLFRQTEPYAIKNQIQNFVPNEQLLLYPFITLAILGYDDLAADVLISATNKNNYLHCEIVFKNLNKVMARFTAKMTAQNPQQSVWDNLKDATVPFQLTYLDNSLKQKLDAYTLSKGLPFVTPEQTLPCLLFK